MPAPIREKLGLISNPKRKKEKIASFYLLKKALLDEKIELSDVATGENGKPFLVDGKYHFNVSHSSDKAILAFSEREIGCDLEKIKDFDLKVAKRFFSPTEYGKIASEEDPERQKELFFRLWTMKESFVKLTGEGFGENGFPTFSPLPDGEFVLDEKCSGKPVFFQKIDAVSGYSCTVASFSPLSDILFCDLG